jgi:hypothetical protein
MKLAEQKFVTIVSPGGIGKTTVAVAVAHEMSTTFNSQTYFIDLSALGAASLVAPAVATALGVSVRTKRRHSSLGRSSAGRANAHHFRLLRTPYRCGVCSGRRTDSPCPDTALARDQPGGDAC